MLDRQYTVRYTVFVYWENCETICSRAYRQRERLALPEEGSYMENRERILKCALDLFYAKGYDAVGIQEICQMAGITKPTLYHYFGSKYGLLETVLKNGFDELFAPMDQVPDPQQGEDVEHMLYEFLSVLTDYAGANYKAYLFLMSLCYSPRENETYRAVQPYLSRIHARAVQIFEAASDRLGNMNGRQEQFAIGFLGLINHYLMMLGNQTSPDEGVHVPEDAKRGLLHQFLHGIYS